MNDMRWQLWTDEPKTCKCTRLVVATLEETLGCPAGWFFAPGTGWCHVLTGPAR